MLALNCVYEGDCIAAKILNRNYILIEKEPEYCKTIKARLKTHDNQELTNNNGTHALSFERLPVSAEH